METFYSTILYVLFFLLNGLCFCNCEETTSEVIVTVKQGTLKGQVIDNIGGGRYYSFQGIPYAEPPLGKLRFKAPLPPASWEGTRDATKQGQNCLQGTTTASGSEDCLYLNVYAPELPAKTENLKPVMVWIHGGAYITGSGDKERFGPDHLIREDVIVVSLNYRLGLMGFFSIDDPSLDAPGNAGLKDQVMALKWVQENIVNFGGNPDDVTIFGESAGGSSVHLLVLSPLAKGLFHKAIVQSSPALELLVYRESNCLLKLLEVLNISETDNAKVLEILRELPADQLFAAQNQVDDGVLRSTPKCYFPVIETASQEPAFLADHPYNIIKSGDYNKVPMVFGFVSREGMVMWTEVDSLLSSTFENLVPYQLGLPKGSNESRRIAEGIREFYFGGKDLSSEVSTELILLLSDTHFLHGMYKSLAKHLQNIGNDVFLYRFSVDGKLNRKRTNNIDAPGAAHGDELGYLFVSEKLTSDITPNGVEGLTIQRMVKLWTNFAKYGNPNPTEASDLINITWQPVEEDNFYFLEIGENLTVGVNPEYLRMKFWDYILNEVLVSYSK